MVQTNRLGGAGLIATGPAETAAVARGIAYLLANQGLDGFWDERRYTATGFPRVVYLHGYAKFFPVWALARAIGISPQPPRPRLAGGM